MRRTESYKGFKIFYNKSKVYKTWNVKIQKRRFENTQREEYYLKYIDTYESKLPIVKKQARKFIDDMKQINWKSSGLQGAKWLDK